LHEQEGVEAATGARDGGEVERYFHEGKIKEIADYCESDVVGTYQVWRKRCLSPILQRAA
jgi:predicted PolB exonuclease-like 3'-5' exonuclease